MLTWQERYVSRFYDRAAGFRDGTTEFHELCAHALPARSVILELGAGRSNATSRYLATLGELHGADPSPVVLENDALVSAAVMSAGSCPFPDASFDACVSNYVLEHIADPALHFREVARVLKPGGAYCFRTPNRYHYVTAVAQLTPHWFHVLVANRLRNRAAEAEEPCPTHYEANTQRDIQTLAARAGLVVEQLSLIEKEPSYGMSSRLLFLTFMAYERLVNATELCANLRVNILGVLRKPLSAGRGAAVGPSAHLD